MAPSFAPTITFTPEASGEVQAASVSASEHKQLLHPNNSSIDNDRRSGTRTSGACSANSSAPTTPVATAMDRTRFAFAAWMSLG